MLPSQLDIVLKRLAAFGAPKDSLLKIFSGGLMFQEFVKLHSIKKRYPNLNCWLKAFILIILLLSWQSFFNLEESAEYQLLEYYAGVGRIARLASNFGYKAGAFDVVYDIPKVTQTWSSSAYLKAKMKKIQTGTKTGMDLTTTPGFVFLDSFYCKVFLGPTARMELELFGTVKP